MSFSEEKGAQADGKRHGFGHKTLIVFTPANPPFCGAAHNPRIPRAKVQT